jgi:hypothetical protein
MPLNIQELNKFEQEPKDVLFLVRFVNTMYNVHDSFLQIEITKQH